MTPEQIGRRMTGWIRANARSYLMLPDLDEGARQAEAERLAGVVRSAI